MDARPSTDPERGLDVRVVEGLGGPLDLQLETRLGRGIHTGQVDDTGHTWSGAVVDEQPQPLALTPRKSTQEPNPPTRHVGQDTTMYPQVRKSCC
jgi:hypothetical protein